MSVMAGSPYCSASGLEACRHRWPCDRIGEDPSLMRLMASFTGDFDSIHEKLPPGLEPALRARACGASRALEFS